MRASEQASPSVTAPGFLGPLIDAFVGHLQHQRRYSDNTCAAARRDLAAFAAYCTRGGFTRLPLLEEAEALLPVLEAAAGPLGTPALCHFDLLPDNFVVAGDLAASPSISIVDYEYTGVGQVGTHGPRRLLNAPYTL